MMCALELAKARRYSLIGIATEDSVRKGIEGEDEIVQIRYGHARPLQLSEESQACHEVKVRRGSHGSHRT